MRDTLKDRRYFEDYISDSIERQNRGLEKIKSGTLKPDRLIPAKLFLLDNLINRIKAMYSIGSNIEDLRIVLIEAIEVCSDTWAGNRKLVGPKNEVLNQYSLDNYDRMLWMLSLGYLLNISKELFKVLANIIEEDKVKDRLFQYIICAKLDSPFKLQKESYKYGWDLFGGLRKAVLKTGKDDAQNLVKNFLEDDWYSEHKNAGWHDNHKSKFNTYSGYWSFESAAVAAIKGLDDSSFQDNEFYPKDLVDYYRSTLEGVSAP